MIQTILRSGLNVGTTSRLSFDGSTTPAAAAGINVNIVGVNTTISNLDVTLTVAPGGATARVFTVYKNGAATALTCTISGAATTGSDTTNSVSFSESDRISLEVTATGGTPATSDVKWSVDSDSDSANSSFYCANLGLAGSAFGDPFHAENNATASLCQRLIAYDGTITKLWLSNINFGVGAGITCTIHFYLNGIKQDGTGGTVDTTTTIVAGAGNSVYSSSFSLSVVRGDYIYYGITLVGAWNSYVGAAFRFEAAADDVSLISMRGGGDPSASSDDFHILTAGDQTWIATHLDDADLICGITPVGFS